MSADDKQSAGAEVEHICSALDAACFPAAEKGQLEADLLPPGQTDFAGVSPGLTVIAHA